MKKSIILFVMFLSLAATAQGIKTSSITWHSSSAFNPVTGVTTEEHTSIVSNSTTSVIWLKEDGTAVQFNVVEVIGEWTSVNNYGEIIYEISNTSTRGNITFVKDSSGIRIKLLFIKGDENPEMNELTIENFEVR